jgi:gamma-glutamyltranspeptidase/glutathione hydrolase
MRKIWLFGDLRRFAIFGTCITAMLCSLAACNGELPPVQFGRIGEPVRSTDFVGLIAGDEPEAVLVGQKIMLANGNAADAAAAIGLALTVTLPSRAGVGGGGACIVHDAKSGKTEELNFLSESSTVRGLFALHARYGVRPWSEVVTPAETLAQLGVTVSRAFAQDLADSGNTLLADSELLTTFLSPARRMLNAGEELRQPGLAAVLAKVRGAGAAVSSGSTPRWIAAHSEHDVFALETRGQKGATTGAGFVVADSAGNAVSCGLTLGRLFGSGKMNDGVLGASSDLESAPLVASMAVINNQVRSGTAGIGSRPPFNTWSCATGLAAGQCDVAAATDRGGYARTVVRGTKM